MTRLSQVKTERDWALAELSRAHLMLHDIYSGRLSHARSFTAEGARHTLELSLRADPLVLVRIRTGTSRDVQVHRYDDLYRAVLRWAPGRDDRAPMLRVLEEYARVIQGTVSA